MTVDTLFDVFCECAELNPEPIEGNFTKIQPFTSNISLLQFLVPQPFYTFVFIEEEEENGGSWVFSADQMDARGGGNVFSRLRASFKSISYTYML